VAGRYKGKIQSWDVVNEAIWIKDGQSDGMRSSSPWFALLGPEYVEIAFRAARAKWAAVLALVKRLKDAGVPIDVVGIQLHLKSSNAARLGDGISAFAVQMRTMRLDVYLTELDVDDDGLPDGSVQEQDMDVADVYNRYLTAMLRGPEVKAALTWGLPTGRAGWRRRSDGPSIRSGWSGWSGWSGCSCLKRCRRVAGTGPTEAFFAMREAIDGAQRR
jgi:endo-1,4-beta-xylanase